MSFPFSRCSAAGTPDDLPRRACRRAGRRGYGTNGRGGPRHAAGERAPRAGTSPGGGPEPDAARARDRPRPPPRHGPGHAPDHQRDPAGSCWSSRRSPRSTRRCATSPGITLGVGEGGGAFNGDQFRIRGFDAKDDIYVDGLRDFGVYTRDSFNYESVEVLKGPSVAAVRPRHDRRRHQRPIQSADARPLHRRHGLDRQRRYAALRRRREHADRRTTSAFRLNLMAHGQETVGRDLVKADRWGAAGSDRVRAGHGHDLHAQRAAPAGRPHPRLRRADADAAGRNLRAAGHRAHRRRPRDLLRLHAAITTTRPRT